ncbi:histidine kinase [Streptomyces sp. NPDC049555]|uniref:sensor histidine kinase n=1 Tax=unclassified Streptomyces TaxID=2593676 RepID=UPI00343F564D
MPGLFTLPDRPHRDDVLIAVAGLLGGLVLWFLGLRGHRSWVPGLSPRWALLALVVMAGLELLRRTMPEPALVLGTLVFAVDLVTGVNLLATLLMFTDLIYAAVLYGPPGAARRVPRTCEALTVVATVVALAVARKPEALLVGVGVAVVAVAPAWTGVAVRTHRDAARVARLNAERTALLAEMDRREAVGAERARMARELHDMVAGHLSAIAIHSSAALSIDEPAASREALGVIRENSVQGLAEMRRLIGLLRDTTGAEEPAATPTLAGLDALVERARAAVPDERFAFRLDDARGPGALPAPVELAAYRIVQESLTNAVKHAAPGEVRVELARAVDGKGGLTVRVTSVLGDGPEHRAPGAGAGVVGMRERVELLGGRLTVGPAAGGAAWEVRAELPVDEEDAG